VNVPIKRGTARRLGLRLPRRQTLWIEGDAFRGSVDTDGGPWLRIGNVMMPVAFDTVTGKEDGSVEASCHIRQLGVSTADAGMGFAEFCRILRSGLS
jgi:hypothetical protein